MPFKKLANKLWWKWRKRKDKELKLEHSSARSGEKEQRKLLQESKNDILSTMNSLRRFGLSDNEIKVLEQNTKWIEHKSGKQEFVVPDQAGQVLARFTEKQKDEVLLSAWVLRAHKRLIPVVEWRALRARLERMEKLNELRKRRGKKELG